MEYRLFVTVRERDQGSSPSTQELTFRYAEDRQKAADAILRAHDAARVMVVFARYEAE